MKCKHCNYEWDNREPEPKACPRCKRRFDYPSSVGSSSIEKNKED